MASGYRSYNAERIARLSQARTCLADALKQAGSIPWDDALPMLLEIPHVWDKDVKELVKAEQDAGHLEIRGLNPKERVPKLGRDHVLVLKRGSK